MIEINLHSVIDCDDANQQARFWGYEGEDLAFSLDTLQRILNEHPDDDQLKINIHCDGGSVTEGLAIYDALRTSGKTIYTNIEGGCHSMAVCILLAAPKENRSANPNCRALIHKVSAPVSGYTNADDLRILADEIEREQESILDIYADRTGTDKDTLREVMKEEKMRTADELLKWGFISRINTYSTNIKPTKKAEMAVKNEKSILAQICDLLTGYAEPVNFDHIDADGNILFTTERENEEIAVGDLASPDGQFDLPDGRKVTIADGVITEIAEAEEEEPAEEPKAEEEKVAESDAEINALRDEVETLKAENEKLMAKVAEMTDQLTETRNQLQSTYTPDARNFNVKSGATPAVKTLEDYKAEMAVIRNKMKH